MNKKAMSSQAIFFILMLILLSGTILFGISRAGMLKQELSEQERREIKLNIKNSLEYCQNPLNQGTTFRFKLENDNFNSLCIIGENIELEDVLNNQELYDEIENSILGTNRNVILLDTMLNGNNIGEFSIYDSIKTEINFKETTCFFDRDNNGEVEVEISCN